MSDWLRKLGPLLGLILVFMLFAMLRPKTFPTADNLQIMMLQTAVVGTAALGMTMVIISGGIDLSVGSAIALSVVVIGVLLGEGASPLMAALGGVMMGALCGTIIGLLITQLKLTPFIATLGMLGILRGVAKGLVNDTPVYPPTTWLNSLLTKLADGQQWLLVPPGVWMMLILALLVAGVLRYTQLGRHFFAIGSNEQTARLCGVPVERTKTIVYMLGSAFAALAGVLQFSYLTIGDPTTAEGKELDIIAAVVIGGGSLSGGEGSVLGSLVGALIMTVIDNGCTKLELPNWVQQIVTGYIIVTAVALDRLRHRREG
ncbi:MAG: ABC transporter permease [candidate division KSB1 bacterium]|nr:ABC transporter permease [candidate division KSB1 bacterium]MDZ7301250.1 ABC transporter permease [candidate division KSB1 bacterium]MDZ7310526.1 ABC transporter permease [candidate division KSB1 bacterium]